MERTRIIIATDPHLCHVKYVDVSTEERMERLKRDLLNEYKKDPYELVLFLGDYSLDFWQWSQKGSWMTLGLCNTKNFIREVCSALPTPYYMLAGNHEQYGEELWHGITGNHRQFSFTVGNYLFICWDSFGANLDPAEHSDGTYTSLPVAWIRDLMAKNPDKYVILCSHSFDEKAEVPEGLEILRDERVLCLFCGHSHMCRVFSLTPNAGNKPLIYSGNYHDPKASPWGFRDLILEDKYLETSYMTYPDGENDCVKSDFWSKTL